jgi:hypothetical protein
MSEQKVNMRYTVEINGHTRKGTEHGLCTLTH